MLDILYESAAANPANPESIGNIVHRRDAESPRKAKSKPESAETAEGAEGFAGEK